jgi:hypothetical protein
MAPFQIAKLTFYGDAFWISRKNEMGIYVNDSYFTHADWHRLLNQAIEYGWEPAGTEPPDCSWELEGGTKTAQENSAVWGGWYCTNDFQRVTDVDARNLGEALIRFAAASEAQEREKPTKWPDDSLRNITEFAHSALKGGFLIR